MARQKEEVISMVDTFQEFKELKNIDRSTMISVLEDSFRSVLAKMFETDENYDIIINPDKGDFEIWKNRTVVADDELQNENMEVSLSEARKTVADIEVGEDFSEEVHFEKFGRRAILNLRQTLAAKILELQKDELYNKYKDLIGRIATAEVYQIWKREIRFLQIISARTIRFVQWCFVLTIPTTTQRSSSAVRAQSSCSDSWSMTFLRLPTEPSELSRSCVSLANEQRLL